MGIYLGRSRLTGVATLSSQRPQQRPGRSVGSVRHGSTLPRRGGFRYVERHPEDFNTPHNETAPEGHPPHAGVKGDRPRGPTARSRGGTETVTTNGLILSVDP